MVPQSTSDVREAEFEDMCSLGSNPPTLPPTAQVFAKSEMAVVFTYSQDEPDCHRSTEDGRVRSQS